MISGISKLVNTNEKRRLFSNFFSLSLLQGANYIFPLITFPYLVRVLGVDYFGLLAFATSTIVFFQIITDYGFNLTATKEISIHRHDKKKVTEVFSSVIIIKFILMFTSLIILTILVFTFDKFRQNAIIYFYTFGTVVGQVLFPVWFFQGMEQMKYITYLNLLSKGLFTLLIFIFVIDKNDYFIVPILTSFGTITAGLISLFLVKKQFGINFELQSINILKKYLKNGWQIFQTFFFLSLYTNSNLFIAGFYVNNTILGHFSIAEKIVNLFTSLFIPINQTIYPYLASIYEKNKIKYKSFVRKIIIIFFILTNILFVLLIVFAENIVEIVTGNLNTEILNVYYILILMIYTAPFASISSKLLVIKKMDRVLNKIVRNVALINLILLPCILFIYGINGMATLVVILQFYLVLRYYVKLKGENIVYK